MIEFPKATAVHRRLPKEAFYKRLTLSAAIKEKFVTDVDRIYVENSLTKDNLNLGADSNIKEILLLAITLKKQDFEARIIEAIARQNPHKLVFLLCFEDKRQLAVYRGRLYFSPWTSENEVSLEAKGSSLTEIWDHIVERVALREEKAQNISGLSIDERLKREDEIKKLQKLIEKSDAAVWREKQPKKRFELFKHLQSYKEKMEKLKHGQT